MVFIFSGLWMKVSDSEFQISLRDNNNKFFGLNMKTTLTIWIFNCQKHPKNIFLKLHVISSVQLQNKEKDNWFKRFSLKASMKKTPSVLFATWEKIRTLSEILYLGLNSTDYTSWTVMDIQSSNKEWLTVPLWLCYPMEATKITL